MHKLLLTSVFFVLLYLGYLLGIDKPNLSSVNKLKNAQVTHQKKIKQLKKRNEKLEQEIQLIKKSPAYLEELARYELGLVKSNETFYQVVEPIE